MYLEKKREIASNINLIVSEQRSPGRTYSSRKADRKLIARLGEELAACYLARLDYRILEKNWRSGRFGEIDLIAIDPSGCIIFIEIKTRRRLSQQCGFENNGFDSVDWRKQRKIAHSAASYLARAKASQAGCRYDVIVVEYTDVHDLIEFAGGADPGSWHQQGIFLKHVTGAFEV